MEHIYPTLAAGFSFGTSGRAAAVWLMLSHHCCWYNAVINRISQVLVCYYLTMYTLRNRRVRVEESMWLGVGGAERSCWSFLLSWDSAALCCNLQFFAGHEVCTSCSKVPGDNSAETVLVCREVWLLWWARLMWEELPLVLCGAAMSVLQRQSLCFWYFAGQFRMCGFSILTDLLILSQGKESKWSETNRWLGEHWKHILLF